MIEAPPPFGIGSDMETVDERFVLSASQPTPWETTDPTSYFRTGRQALRFISEQLWLAGHRVLLFPEFYCESMLEPFETRPWQITPIRVTDNLMMDASDFENGAAQATGPCVALFAEYFGRQLGPDARNAISRIQAAGGVVIEDETHRVLNPDPTEADIRIASLRKVLPVADGAYVIGGIAVEANSIPRPEVLDAERWAAMDDKAAPTGGSRTVKSIRDHFEQANHALEADYGWQLPSARTLDALRFLDYAKLAGVRATNAAALERELERMDPITVLNPRTAAPVPSHLVIRVPHANRVQAALAERRIYCPIHWLPPTDVIGLAPWPSDILSVPVDHRYTEDDMRFVARTLRKVVAA